MLKKDYKSYFLQKLLKKKKLQICKTCNFPPKMVEFQFLMHMHVMINFVFVLLLF